jgi:hypothetical protein
VLSKVQEYKSTPKPPRHNIIGLLADLKVDLTEANIAEARREMWANFPRDIEI